MLLLLQKTTAVQQLTNLSSDDESGVRHGYRAKVSLPLTLCISIVYDITRLGFVALWKCLIKMQPCHVIHCGINFVANVKDSSNEAFIQ